MKRQLQLLSSFFFQIAVGTFKNLFKKFRVNVCTLSEGNKQGGNGVGEVGKLLPMN